MRGKKREINNPIIKIRKGECGDAPESPEIPLIPTG